MTKIKICGITCREDVEILNEFLPEYAGFVNIPNDNKLFVLAGGLDFSNVSDAIKIINPDIVDVSSGVENDTKTGKSREKVAGFITAVRKSI